MNVEAEIARRPRSDARVSPTKAVLKARIRIRMRKQARLSGWRRSMAPLIARFAFFAAFAFAPQLPASAQQGAETQGDGSTIVIEGLREREKEIERFVGALTEAPVRGQLARFDWAICPAVAGLTEAQNQAIVERMRRVAQAADMDVAAPACRPNAIVIVTPDKDRMMRWLRRQAPGLFIDPLGDRIRIDDQEGPAIAWQVQGRLDADGMEASVDLVGNYYVVESTISPSRITAASRPHFQASVLVVEVDALKGLTTTQVADYAAMRVFARTDPERLDRSSAPTILRILDSPIGSEVPITLTEWDLGFLRGLYGSAENHYASRQRHEIRRRLRQDLERQP